MANEPKPPHTTDREYQFFALRIVGDFGASIAIPVVILALAGQYLDEKYQTSPWFIIIGFVLAATVSARIIYKKSKQYGKEYQRLNTK